MSRGMRKKLLSVSGFQCPLEQLKYTRFFFLFVKYVFRLHILTIFYSVGTRAFGFPLAQLHST